MSETGSLLSGLTSLADAKTRSISPENFHGEKGRGGMAVEGTGKECARQLGQGWKISPSVEIAGKELLVLADIEGSGIIQHIWLTCPHEDWRSLILRMYWDEEENPSIEVPLGDFFCMGWCEPGLLQSIPVCVNPNGGMNCYWQMPFRKGARITLENLTDKKSVVYYQITYSQTHVAEDTPYFHAQFSRDNPLEYKKNHVILQSAEGRGQYVGTYLAWGVNSNRWWGEGEIKFFMDGDKEFPTICGTGTEDYFCGSYNFENQKTHQYQEFTTPYAGMHQVIRPDGLYRAVTAFGLYRWHILDPVRFEKDLKVTIQDLGWRHDGRYNNQKSDISSTTFWYQVEPHAKFPALPSKDDLEIPRW